MMDRPFDILNELKGKKIEITLKNEKKVRGILLGFDLNINLGIDSYGTLCFVRGGEVMFVTEIIKAKEVKK